MKKRSLFIRAIAIAILSMFLLSACQPTPDKPIINAGDDSELNDKINATPIPTPEPPEDTNEPIITLSTIYGFPTEQKDEFECADTSVSVNVDAAVVVPAVQSVPVAEVEPINLQTDFVKNFAEKMHPGVNFYDTEAVLLKSEAVQQFEFYQEEVAKPWEEFLKKFDGDEKEAKEWYDQCQAMLKEYKELVKTAPETEEQKPTDFTYHDMFGYYMQLFPEIVYTQNKHGETLDVINNGFKYLKIRGTTDDSMYIRIEGRARFTGDIDSSFTYYFGNVLNHANEGSTFDKPGWNGSLAEKRPIENSEAIAIAADALEKMGIADEMALSSVYGRKGGRIYELKYYRGFSGLVGSDVTIENEYNYAVGNESVSITINDGVVTKIEYENPYEITEIENSNVELISFERAYDAFKKQARLEFTKEALKDFLEAFDKEYEVKSCDATITKINFVMVRIPIKNGGYRYVPAWQFVGNCDFIRLINEKEYNHTENDRIFMTINAVDGTRIAGME